MGIKVAVPGYLPQNQTLEVDGSTVGECLRQAMERQPNLRREILDAYGNLNLDAVIVVNGETVDFNAAARSVKDGDEIRIAIIEFTSCG